MKKDITKAELISQIKVKASKIPDRFQPAVNRVFLNGLKYKTKPQLKRIASKMKVEWDRHGWDITTG